MKGSDRGRPSPDRVPYPAPHQLVVFICACFLARLLFYASVLPIWEGYDEWAHFSVISSMASSGRMLVTRDQLPPRDVVTSLHLAPVPWDMRNAPGPVATEESFWDLAKDTREQRAAEFKHIPDEWSGQQAPGFTTYEALQPPLYYWLMTPIFRATRGLGLAAQVFTIRYVGIAFACLVIPILFYIARECTGDDRLALCACALAAVMPGLALDVARVGNDSLAILLFSLLIWLGLKPKADWAPWCLGVVLGLGLLTKAYFLVVLLPAMAWMLWRRRRFSDLTPILVPAAIAGWWYWRNLRTTGTLSGLSEALLLRGMTTTAMLKKAATVPWGKAIDAILFSHLYYGGWSSLTVRSWIYHVLYAVFLLAAVGLFRSLWKPGLQWLIVIYAAFWLGQIYNVLLLYLSKGLAGSMGWYLYAVVAAEATLCVAGLAGLRRWAAPCAVVLFALLDLYTVHAIAIPYFTGLIAHKANGSLAAVQLADARALGFAGVVARLAVFKPAWISEPTVVILWVVYFCGTLAIAVIAAFPPPSHKS